MIARTNNTAPFVNTLEYNPEEYYKCWTGSERGMLLYRIKEMKDYFGNRLGIDEMLERLSKATENEKAIIIE